MRRSAKFHVDSAVRFWAIANIREGGRQTPPPPPVKRGLTLKTVNELVASNQDRRHEVLTVVRRMDSDTKAHLSPKFTLFSDFGVLILKMLKFIKF